MGKQIGIANERFWRDFASDGSFYGKLEQIKMMDSVLNDPHYTGVGYIELTADITDPEAIQKIVDGRFLTGSVGAVSDKAVCSVCSTNWLEEEHCGHKPGRLYDGKKCFIVAGALEYDEWSFVNTPADRHAVVLSAGQQSISDGVVEDSASRVLFLFPSNLLNEEGSHMEDTATEVKSEKANIQDAATEQDLDVQDAAADLTENTEEASLVDGPTASVSLDDSVNETEAVQQSKDSQQKAQPFELALEKLFLDSGSSFTDEDEEVLYEAMINTLTEEDGFSVEDAKLSASARKKLPVSVFCGPARSFPVSDSVHYIAAKRLLDLYTGSGNKSEIASCIERKGKALGCTQIKTEDALTSQPSTESADTTESPSEMTLELAPQSYMPQKGEVSVATAVLDELETKLGKEAVEMAVLDRKLAVSKEMLELQVEETLKKEDALADLRDQLSALRRELSATYDDVAQLEDRLIEKASEAREAKLARLRDLHRLDGSLNEGTESSFAAISDEALDNSLSAILAKVDTAKIADRLNDGLSRIPDETVENPAAVTEPSSAAEIEDSVVKSTEAKPSFATQRMVDETYHYLFVKQGNPHKAKQYYTDMVTAGMAAADPAKMLNHDNKEE